MFWTITGGVFQKLFVLAFLLMSTAFWSPTAEAISRYDMRVSIKSETLSVDTNSGCTHIEGSARAGLSAEEPKIEITIRGFFEALRRDDKIAFQRLTTDSFYSFDGGRRFAGLELLELVRDTHVRGVQLNWNIGTIDIHLGSNMAWTAWENSGSAGVSTNLRSVRWLESAVLVKKEGTWKIDFLHSSRAALPEGTSN